jgi:hypothetical protein
MICVAYCSKIPSQRPSNQVGLSPEMLNSGSLLLLLISSNTNPPTDVEIGYLVSEILMMQFDKEANAWKSSGCRVSLQSLACTLNQD